MVGIYLGRRQWNFCYVSTKRYLAKHASKREKNLVPFRFRFSFLKKFVFKSVKILRSLSCNVKEGVRDDERSLQIDSTSMHHLRLNSLHAI